jgi:hypothetical protein
LVLDSDGSIITSGFLDSGTVDFGGTEVSGPSYIAKYDPNGTLLWVHTGATYGNITVDRERNIYYAGSSWATGSAFGKLSPQGDVVWSRSLPATAYPADLVVDSSGHLILSMSYEGTVRLDDHIVTNPPIEQTYSYENILIAQADTQGKFKWVLTGGHGLRAGGPNLAAGPDGKIYVAGIFWCGDRGVDNGGAVDCGPATLGTAVMAPLNPGGGTEIYVAKLTLPAVAPPVSLSARRQGSVLELSWPASAVGYVLERADAKTGMGSWVSVASAPAVENERSLVRLQLEAGAKVFRLRKQ